MPSEQDSTEVEQTRIHYAIYTAKHLVIVTAISGAGMCLLFEYDPNPLQAVFTAVMVWELLLRVQVLEYAANAIGIVFPSRVEALRDEI